MSDKPAKASNQKPLAADNDNPSPLLQRLDALDAQRAVRAARRKWMADRVMRQLLVKQRPELRRRRPF